MYIIKDTQLNITKAIFAILIAAIAAYIIDIMLIFCPDKLLKGHGIVDPKRTKIARIVGIAVIIVINVIIVGMYILNHT